MGLSIYTASCLRHAPMWLDIHRTCPEVHWTARWPAYVAANVCETPELARNFWQDDECDVRAADVVLVYAHGDDVLRGAICEAGMGIALGKQVWIVGESTANSYNTWQYHPRCLRMPKLISALVAAKVAPVNVDLLTERWSEHIHKYKPELKADWITANHSSN